MSKSANRRRALREKQNGLCFYCGVPMRHISAPIGRTFPPDTETIEHVIPRALGGPLGMANRVLACLQCNRSRAHWPISDMIEWAERLLNHQRQKETDHGDTDEGI